MKKTSPRMFLISTMLFGCAAVSDVDGAWDGDGTGSRDGAALDTAGDDEVTASIRFQNKTSDGYCAKVTVSNNGPSVILKWRMIIEVGDVQISRQESADFHRYDDRLWAKSMQENVIEPSTSTNFSFCVTTSKYRQPKIADFTYMSDRDSEFTGELDTTPWFNPGRDTLTPESSDGDTEGNGGEDTSVDDTSADTDENTDPPRDTNADTGDAPNTDNDINTDELPGTDTEPPSQPDGEICDQQDNDKDGLIDEANVCDTNPRVLIIVSSPLIKTSVITNALATYQADILAEGWSSAIVAVNNTSDELADKICATESCLKSYIQQFYKNGNGIEGIVFIGSAPAIPNAFWRYHRIDNNRLPTDMYYADMDEWVDLEADGTYESYDSRQDTATNEWVVDITKPANPNNTPYTPDIFYGRITAGPLVSSIQEEAELVRFYLDKVHQYRLHGSDLSAEQSSRAFFFQDDDFSNSQNFYSWQNLSNHIKLICDPDTTTTDTLVQEMERGYRFIYTKTHSSTEAFSIHEWQDGYLSIDDSYDIALLRNISVNADYIHMINSSANRFSVANIGAAYLFRQAHPLNTTGTAGAWGFDGDDLYYKNLAEGIPTGAALLELAKRYIQSGNGNWPNVVLQGDPLLTYPITITNKAPFIKSDLRKIVAIPGEELLVNIITEDPENDPVTVEVVEGLPDGAVFEGTELSWTAGIPDSPCRTTQTTLKATDTMGNSYLETFGISVCGIQNGGFERGEDVADSWYRKNEQQSGILQWENGTGIDGGRCVSITKNGSNDGTWYQPVDGLIVGETYRLGVWVRGSDIAVPDGDDKFPSLTLVHGTDSPKTYNCTYIGTFDWVNLGLTFEATSPSMGIEFLMGSPDRGDVTGTVWYDDVTLQHIE